MFVLPIRRKNSRIKYNRPDQVWLSRPGWHATLHRSQPHPSRRSGLTLLEVLLATAIFLGSITAIMQVLSLGHDSRISAKLDAEAAVLCESKLGEYVSGMVPLVAESDVPFPESREWFFTSTVEDGGGESLLKLTVLVEHKPNGQQPTSYFQLSRLIRDPELFLEAAMSAASAEDTE